MRSINYMVPFLLVVLANQQVACSNAKYVNQTVQSGIVHEIEINIQDEKQRMQGFGASDAWRCKYVGKNWPLQKKEKIADLLFSQEIDNEGNPKGIGLSLWRFYIGAGSQEQGEASGIANEWRRAPSFLSKNGTWDWGKYKGQRWFLKAAQKRGVEKFLAFSIAPPVFMSQNGKAFNKPGEKSLNIAQNKLDDYADFLVGVLDHFHREENLTFDYISPINEPQWDWGKATQEGSAALNQDMYDLTRLLSQRLVATNLPTQIVLGEAGTISYLSGKVVDGSQQDEQIITFFDPGSEYYIGNLPNVRNTISGHSYFTTWPLEKLVKERKILAESLQKVDPDLEYWQTEFSILEKTDEIGAGWERDLGMNTALYVARVIHADLTIANAASWHWWTALTTYDFKDGLIYLDNGHGGIRGYNSADAEILKKDGFVRDSKLLWAFGNFSRFVRPGMVRVSIENKSFPSPEQEIDNLMVSAYKDTKRKKLVVVCINYTENDMGIRLLDKGEDLRIKDSLYKSYTTSKEHDLEKGVLKGNELKIPARSVITLVGELSQ